MLWVIIEKMKNLFLIIILIGLVRCTNKSIDKQDNSLLHEVILIEKMPEKIPNFHYLRQDDSLDAAMIVTERLVGNVKTKSIDFDRMNFLTNCDCEIDSGKLKIKLFNNGGWSYQDMKIEISKTLKAINEYSNDISCLKTSPQFIKLEINHLNPSISDTIYGKILSIHDTIYKQSRINSDTGFVDIQLTEKYLGYFRCKINAHNKKNRKYIR